MTPRRKTRSLYRGRSAGTRAPLPAGAEEGSGSVLALGVAAALCAALVVSAPLYGGILLKRSLMNAADASALAGAFALLGAASGVPCERAAATAAINGARLAACRVEGWAVWVTVSGTVAGFPVSVFARAGLRDPPSGVGAGTVGPDANGAESAD